MFMSGGSKLNYTINITYFKSFATMSLSRLVMHRRKRDFLYFVNMGLVLGLCHETGAWKREDSQHQWDDTIVKRTYDDNVWIDNFRTTRGTLFYICDEFLLLTLAVTKLHSAFCGDFISKY